MKTPAEVRWESALRRARGLPNRPAWDGDAATLLIAATGNGTALPVIPHPDRPEEW